MLVLAGRFANSLRSRLRRLVYPVVLLDRELLARRFIQGEGVEVGGLQHPTPVKARVKYVDRERDMSGHYPEHGGRTVRVDIADDAQTLSTLADSPQDFLIANRVPEHLPDPLAAPRNWFRVVRPGGVVFFALPDKRRTFDRDREVMPLAHVIADHEGRGPHDFEHFRS